MPIACPFIRKLVRLYGPENDVIQVIPVINHFFGETITVTGLIVGRDLIEAMKDVACDTVLICDTMLRENSDRFLDDMTLEEVSRELRRPIRVVQNNGEALIRALWGLEEENV